MAGVGNNQASPGGTCSLLETCTRLGHQYWSLKAYQPSGAAGTRSPPAMPYRLQNPKWPSGGPKIANRVWKGVEPYVIALRPTFAK